MLHNTSASAQTSVPPLSRRLLPFIEQLAAQEDDNVEVQMQAIRSAVPEYGRHASETLLDSVRAMIRANHRLWFGTLLEQRLPRENDLTSISAAARERFHQGIPITSVLHCYRVATSASWLHAMKVADTGKDPLLQSELLLTISPYLLQHCDLIRHLISQSYQQERERSQRWKGRYQQELCALILDEPDNAARFQHLAEQLEIHPYARRTAVVIKLRSPALGSTLTEGGSADDLSPLTRHLDDDDGLISTHHQDLVITWTVTGPDNPVLHQRELEQRCVALIRSGAPVEAIGIGLWGSGAAGWHDSAEQALRALRLRDADVAIARYSERILEDAALTPGHHHEYFEALLSLLPEGKFLRTLDVYLSTPSLTRKAAAARLHIHPNTLDYRLRRISELLGADLEDTAWLARLHVALRLHHLKADHPEVVALR